MDDPLLEYRLTNARKRCQDQRGSAGRSGRGRSGRRDRPRCALLAAESAVDHEMDCVRCSGLPFGGPGFPRLRAGTAGRPDLTADLETRPRGSAVRVVSRRSRHAVRSTGLVDAALATGCPGIGRPWTGHLAIPLEPNRRRWAPARQGLIRCTHLPLTALYVCALPYGGQDVGPGQA